MTKIDIAERYWVEHETRYAYTAPVSQSWQLARLTPRRLPWQRLTDFSLDIEPKPDERRDEQDSFGNTVTHFGLHAAHRMLRVRMQCRVEVLPRPLPADASAGAGPAPGGEAQAWAASPSMGGAGDSSGVLTQGRGQGEGQGQLHDAPARPAAPDTARPGAERLATPLTPFVEARREPLADRVLPMALAYGGPSWEAVRDAVRRHPGAPEHLQAARMSESTPLVPLSEAARAYALASFPRGRDWFEAVYELMQRIYRDFEFEPGATTVSTSVDEVLHQRSGVCQDFAHLMLASLRGLGLPARYVSGYLLTEPPPGQPRLMGVDASHAWVAAYSPAHGWVEFDPTNDQLADQRYITLSWGADFADVVPLRGVILGGGEQGMAVEVSVVPQA